MKEQIIAKRYAQAYVSYARSAVGVPGIVDEFKGLKQIIQDNPGLREFFENPGITDSEKYRFIDSVFAKGFSGEFRVFLKLLIEKSRIILLDQIIDFIRVNYAYGETTEALLETAYPMDLDLVSKIESALEKKLGKRLHFYLKIDGSLLGGVRAVVGNTIIDGTLKRRLDEISQEFKELRVN
jgi:F-type H+-transporting ATPase subunit delta